MPKEALLMPNGKDLSTLSFDAAIAALSAPAKEAMAERTYAMAIAEKLNYRDAFSSTPAEFLGSIVKRFSHWHKDLSDDSKRDFLLLSNVGIFADWFIDHLKGKAGLMTGYIEEYPELFREDIILFISMHVFDAKAEQARAGVLAFFSPEGQRFALLRTFAKCGRTFMHEAMGRARKYDYGSEEDMERVLGQIVRELLMKHMGDLFETLSLPALAAQDSAICLPLRKPA
jgi:hypothetical protein